MAVHLDEGIDAGLVWHYGNPVAEARLMETGKGVAALVNREIVEVTGEERLQFLHLISTQHLQQLQPGQATTALFLSPHGHIEHVLHGVDDGTSFMSWTEPGRADAIVAHLNRMRFAMRVEAVRRDDLTLHWVGHQVPVPEGARTRDSDLGGTEVFSPVGLEANVGTWAYDAARIAAGVPRIFVDTDHRTIPNEIGLFGTHLDKGCYPGQETVGKIHTLGRPPRRLVQLHLDGSLASLPAQGAEIMLGERAVGVVGSSARHHELGPIALGLVKRNVETSAEFVVDGIPAAQEVLVDPDVGLHVRPVLR